MNACFSFKQMGRQTCRSINSRQSSNNSIQATTNGDPTNNQSPTVTNICRSRSNNNRKSKSNNNENWTLHEPCSKSFQADLRTTSTLNDSSFTVINDIGHDNDDEEEEEDDDDNNDDNDDDVTSPTMNTTNNDNNVKKKSSKRLKVNSDMKICR